MACAYNFGLGFPSYMMEMSDVSESESESPCKLFDSDCGFGCNNLIKLRILRGTPDRLCWISRGTPSAESSVESLATVTNASSGLSGAASSCYSAVER
jgi:hypothetical protein